MDIITATIEIPYPPTANTYYRMSRGRMYLTAKGEKFKTDCVHLMMSKRFPRAMIGDVHVEIHVFPPDYRKRDIDNIIKPVLDAMQDYGVFESTDEQISSLRVQRRAICTPYGRAELTVSGMLPESK